MVVLFLVACMSEKPVPAGSPVPDATSTPAPTSQTTPSTTQEDLCGADPACTNVWELDHHWTADGEIHIELGDLDGNGDTDALVRVGSQVASRVFVVLGPLDRDVVLPGDAAAELQGTEQGAVRLVGDMDGDGRDDVAWSAAWFEGDWFAVSGPFDGAVDLTTLPVLTTVPDWPAEIYDLDGDGDVEWMVDDAQRYDHLSGMMVYDGPYRDGDEPMLRVESTCDDGDYREGYGGDWSPVVRARPADFDGDGVRDLSLASEWGCADGTGTLTVSGAARGLVTEGDPGVLAEVAGGSVGDVDRDGATDMLVAFDTWTYADGSVLAGPLSDGSALLGTAPDAFDPAMIYPLSDGRVIAPSAPDRVSVLDGILSGAVQATWPAASAFYDPDQAPDLLFVWDASGAVGIARIEP